MNILMLTLLLAYLAALFWFLRYRYLPRCTPIGAEARTNPRYRLAINTHQVLGLLHGVLLFLAVIWGPVVVVLLLMTAGAGPGHTPGDISIHANLYVDLAQLPDVVVSGLQQDALRASTELDLTAPNAINFFLFVLTSLIKLLLMLFVILQMRNALASYCNGESFRAGNSKRLKQVGQVMVFAYLAGPLWQWFLSASVINAIAIDNAALSISPALSGSWLGLFVGIGLIILAGVIRDAEVLQQEQGLTI